MNSNPIVKGKLVCVALNDAQQLAAMQAEFSQAPYKAAPTQPVLYFKPHNTWNTDGAVIEWPAGEAAMVVGASLAVVMGQECCRVSADEALNFVGGYTLLHDFSLPEQSYYRPDIKGKCLDGSAPVGAAVVAADQVADPAALTVVTQVNGETVSELPMSQLERSVPELISIVSRIMTLQAGDVLAVGFRGERTAVQRSDRVTSAIAGVAELNNQLAD
ncbi:fumarylacetoacetate hydrolase family protein [Aliamphritea hakodatensis]|uniref:fumarylacetoacetate hydrolase family protein n=1 Tax=Aliamphritea hakodatensis TaxID=2895352 RepID=UPI0022FDA256|nr:fumarylacetoacetate hydrolase family protein [Aliamphritea hakodatensis]